MTGYASASSNGAQGATLVTVEARSVNGRFLDLAFRMPDEMRGIEPALREMVGAALRRGKVEFRIGTAREGGDDWPHPSAEQLNRLAHLQGSVQSWLPQARPLSVNEALNWCRGGSITGGLDESTLDAARRCIEGLREARAREGERLAAMLRERTARLRELAARAAPLVPAVVRRQQERFLERWNEALAAAQGTAAGGAAGEPGAAGGGTFGNASGATSAAASTTAHERALAEAASYALRIDVAEELSRLGAHVDEIDRLLDAGGELGKRLDFLIQELNREANTLGSKSAGLELTGIAVEMKVLIEQMREQVQNLE